MDHDARAEEGVLYQLKTRGPMTAAQAARRLKVTPMAVRQHLYRLHEAGLVEYSDERRKVGRPARVWRLTAESAARFPDTHADLTLEMIGAVRAAFGEKGMDRVLTERSRLQLAEYRARMRPAGNSIAKRAEMLASIRREQGYMAECARQPDGSLLLIENHCPICAAAATCQGLCRDELSLFRAVVGAKARVERVDHILAGARRCAYKITALK
ncbi:MAG TPA: metalloregulator ArsR/SmtB family transcription factor [Candidatus Acidoferrales bacterium]|nr:metalloregulator ArsR/SmtB family transcription factor [Candidatus Acidoferrales bacterium]